MKQSRLQSFIESLTSTAVGFGLSLLCQWLFFAVWLGLPLSLTMNLTFAVIMTGVSIGRQFILRRAFEFFRVSRRLSASMQAVIAERWRQEDTEGWDAAHDDQHTDRSMALVAALYAAPEPLYRIVQTANGVSWRDPWPWINKAAADRATDRPAWDKRQKHDERRRLVIAGALIVAELDRLDRARRGKPGTAA